MIHHQDDAVTVYAGDCLDVLRTLESESVEAVVTDPPYSLSFMGRTWDEHESPLHFQQWCEQWARECLRILKPGGHLLAFGGTRTGHRLASGIEDAGFEMRDSIAWLYGSGFAKSWNFKTQYRGTWCECNPLPWSHADNADVSRVRDDIHPSSVEGGAGQDAVLLATVQRGSEGSGMGAARSQGPRGVASGNGGTLPGEDQGRGQSVLAGRELPRRQGLPASEDAGSPERAAERLRPRARPGDGTDDRSASGVAGGGAPHQRTTSGQPTGKPAAVPESHRALDDGALRDGAICARCGGLDPVYKGFGSALKPAFEPVVVARKPLIGTLARTAEAHGTGALNIDACRVAHDEPQGRPAMGQGGARSGGIMSDSRPAVRVRDTTAASTAGRWPPNVILDDQSAAELDRQSGTFAGVASGMRQVEGPVTFTVGEEIPPKRFTRGVADYGGASRFFPTFRYEPKAPTHERPRVKQDGASKRIYDGIGDPRCTKCGRQRVNVPGSFCVCDEPDFQPDPSKAGHVAHPTVKPLDLMRWLVRLVTPPGGVVLDPFAGSGTTGEACIVEGFRAILIEREPDYLPLIVARLTKPIAGVLDFGGVA